MKKIPEFAKERERLLLRSEEYKRLINNDIREIKESLRPVAVVKDLVGNVFSHFRHNGNGIAAQGSSMALKMLPSRWARQPVVGMAISTLLPILLRRLPQLLDAVRGKTTSVSSREKILGTMKNAVSGLRQRIREKI